MPEGMPYHCDKNGFFEGARMPGFALLLGSTVAALAPATTPKLETVQVTATRNAKSASVVPAAITVVEGSGLSTDSIGINLPEKLGGVPGVLARERQNYAQDVQISIRGFGARSTFGIRGLRLYLDGVPATMPDGQGQVSNFNLVSAGRIEVLRGPFSTLYGNASGGVIQMFTADGASDPGARLGLAYGSDDSQRESLDFRGVQGSLDYNVALTHFSTDGFREHSRAQRDSFNSKLKFAIGDGGTFTLLANALHSPIALDPLGLTAQQMQDDPRQAVTAATQFNSRKALEHQQAGAIFEHALSPSQTIRLLGYGGTRDVTQFLAIPVGAQNSPLSGGGVVDLHSRFSGADARWTVDASLASRPLQLVIGVNVDRQDQHRLGFNNFLGAALGVRGLLRRDELNRVTDFDQYAEANWSASEKLELLLGLRHSQVRFQSDDRFVTASNPNDSGRRAFSATSPVLGITYHPDASWNLYASYGKGFETPTFDELGYRPDGSAGLNFALQPARSRSVEVGAKARLSNRLQFDASVFRADTNDELAVATNAGGRATFQNVGHARRQGFELSVLAQWNQSWRSQLAYTLLDARFRDDFLTCTSSPCATPSVLVPAGSQIPGIARTSLHLDTTWQGQNGWHATLTGQAVDSMAVDNAGDARAHPYAVFDLSAGYRFPGGDSGIEGFVRLGNIFDRHYAGSVIVNETSGRYYEPAPGRSFLVGVDWRW
jgi:iron complex outermembrane receptor protein